MAIPISRRRKTCSSLGTCVSDSFTGHHMCIPHTMLDAAPREGLSCVSCADVTVRDYLASTARLPLLTSPTAVLPWKQALCQAFQVQLTSLENDFPAVILATTADSPAGTAPEAASLPTSPLPLSLSEQRQKRKWTAGSSSTPLNTASRTSPEAKLPRTRGQPQAAHLGQKPRGLADDQPEEELFAVLSLHEQQPQSDASDRLQQEAEAHTAWMKALMDAGEPGNLPQQQHKRGKASGLDSELYDSCRYSMVLRELKGGF